jgi:NAD(P)-dependent dehydrogenase (short-subunit alcohol dehydrogenase family)
MTEIALEFGRAGITANTVSPGPMNTTRKATKKVLSAESLERMAIPRLGEPIEVAEACRFLASEAGAYITGQTIRVSGGLEF